MYTYCYPGCRDGLSNVASALVGWLVRYCSYVVLPSLRLRWLFRYFQEWLLPWKQLSSFLPLVLGYTFSESSCVTEVVVDPLLSLRHRLCSCPDVFCFKSFAARSFLLLIHVLSSLAV